MAVIRYTDTANPQWWFEVRQVDAQWVVFDQNDDTYGGFDLKVDALTEARRLL